MYDHFIMGESETVVAQSSTVVGYTSTDYHSGDHVDADANATDVAETIVTMQDSADVVCALCNGSNSDAGASHIDPSCDAQEAHVASNEETEPPLPLRAWEIIVLLTRRHLLLTVDTKQEVLLQREDKATSTHVSGETGVHTTHDSSSFSQVPKYSEVDQDLHSVQASHLSYGLTVSFMTQFSSQLEHYSSTMRCHSNLADCTSTLDCFGVVVAASFLYESEAQDLKGLDHTQAKFYIFCNNSYCQ